MGNTKIQKLEKKIDKLEEKIGERVDCDTLDLIYKLIELNILLENECNK